MAENRPRVAAVMLCSPGREAYQSQAIRALTEQTYDNVRLVQVPAVPGVSIGEMRNRANALAATADIIVHWDDDDWSHPRRIEEQVKALNEADCVGYNEMLFWKESVQDRVKALVTDKGGWTMNDLAKYGVSWPPPSGWLSRLPTGEAWLYSNPNPGYALGTSLCYWRRAWESSGGFMDLQHGEDTEWIRGLDCFGKPGLDTSADGRTEWNYPGVFDVTVDKCRMIARIHAGNSSSAYDPIEMARHNALPRSERQWSRVPEWDEVCRKVMEG